jgi:hypothetical protein
MDAPTHDADGFPLEPVAPELNKHISDLEGPDHLLAVIGARSISEHRWQARTPSALDGPGTLPGQLPFDKPKRWAASSVDTDEYVPPPPPTGLQKLLKILLVLPN